MNFAGKIKDRITPQDFGVPDTHAEAAEYYAQFVAHQEREACAKIALEPENKNRITAERIAAQIRSRK